MHRIFLALAVVLSSLGSAVATKPPSAHVVFMIGEDEYHTWETLPEFAERDLKPLGYRLTVINADAADKNNFPGLVAALKTADVLVLSVRRRTPPAEQLNAVRAHLAAGKPLVGIRTACHAFALRPTDPPAAAPLSTWQGFDPEVLGGHYTNHHPAGPRAAIVAAARANAHQILSGISFAQFSTPGSLYKVSPLENDTTVLLTGSIPGEPSEPVAWTRLYGPKRARVFYTSLGHPDDFKTTEFRRLLVDGIAWALGK